MYLQVIERMLHVITNFRRLKVDVNEYVTLKALALMLPGNTNLLCNYHSVIWQDYT